MSEAVEGRCASKLHEQKPMLKSRADQLLRRVRSWKHYPEACQSLQPRYKPVSSYATVPCWVVGTRVTIMCLNCNQQAIVVY
jgi:hypothetical protein